MSNERVTNDEVFDSMLDAAGTHSASIMRRLHPRQARWQEAPAIPVRQEAPAAQPQVGPAIGSLRNLTGDDLKALSDAVLTEEMRRGGFGE